MIPISLAGWQRVRWSGLMLGGLVAALPLASSAQVLETETARFMNRGSFEIGLAYEFQTSADGREYAAPIAFEYALTNRVSVLVEPVPYTSIRPRTGRRATGAGDLEITISFLAVAERSRMPALAFAGEVKVPTARDTLIGTRKTDYAFYAIGSKKLGRFDSHANIGYTFVGKPAGFRVSNVLYGALATEFRATAELIAFGEALVQTAAVPDGESGDASGGQGVPELGGNETVGTLGVGYAIKRGAVLSFSVSRDNNAATLFRTGLTLRWLPKIPR